MAFRSPDWIVVLVLSGFWVVVRGLETDGLGVLRGNLLDIPRVLWSFRCVISDRSLLEFGALGVLDAGVLTKILSPPSHPFSNTETTPYSILL